jgi:hypothetical protein
MVYDNDGPIYSVLSGGKPDPNCGGECPPQYAGGPPTLRTYQNNYYKGDYQKCINETPPDFQWSCCSCQ